MQFGMKDFSKHATILKQAAPVDAGAAEESKDSGGFSIHVLGPGSRLGLLLDLDNGTVGGQQQARDRGGILQATCSTLVGTITPALTIFIGAVGRVEAERDVVGLFHHAHH